MSKKGSILQKMINQYTPNMIIFLKKRSNTLKEINPLTLLLIISFWSAVVVFVCHLKFNDFFFIDDAQSATWGFYREMGRQWLNGDIPWMTTRTLFGSNILLEICFTPFNPQVIISSIFFALTETAFELQTGFFAWLNITLMMLGGYALGRSFDITQGRSLILAFMLGTFPMVLFLFLASWWNHALGQVWFTFALAAFFNFRKDNTVKNLLLIFISVALLFTTGIVQSYIAYFVLVYTILIMDIVLKSPQALKNLITITMGLISAIFIIFLPLSLEYLMASEFISRHNGFGNAGGAFLTPNLWHQILFFMPNYGGFMHWFGGYRYIAIPLGYATILALPVLCFSKLESQNDKKNAFIIIIALVTVFLLSQTPSQLGSTRWPFRYIPLYLPLIALLTVYLLNFGKWSLTLTRNNVFFLALLIATFVSTFSQESDKPNITIFYNFLLILIIYLKMTVNKKKENINNIFLITVSFFSFLLNIYFTPTLNNGFWPYQKLEKTPSIPVLNNGRNLLLTNDFSSNSSILMGYGFKTINGYTPVGHTELNKLLPSNSAHAFLNATQLLDTWIEPEKSTMSPTVLQVSGVTNIIDLNNQINIQGADYLHRNDWHSIPLENNKGIQWVLNNPPLIEGTLSWQDSIGTTRVTLKNFLNESKEIFSVPYSDKERTLYFSRIYWPGYHAYLNDKEIFIDSYKKAFLKILLPARTNGELIIEYRPLSFHYFKNLFSIGMLFLFISCFITRKKRHSKLVPATPYENN